jgi:hypothetical protein
MLTLLLSGEYPATELTEPAWDPRYAVSARTQQKTPPTFLSIVMGGRLAIAWMSLTCLPAATKQRMFLLATVA